jgi:hypothetical protein
MFIKNLKHSKHNALQANLSPDQLKEIEKYLLEKIRGRDFVMIVLEHPTATIITTAEQVSDAKAIVNHSLAKPWA